jgi:hypothetical protein
LPLHAQQIHCLADSFSGCPRLGDPDHIKQAIIALACMRNMSCKYLNNLYIIMFSKEIAMNRIHLTLLSLVLLLPAVMPAAADELQVGSAAAGSSVPTPQRGASMEQVRQQFGAPVTEHPTVSANGGPHQPPITRWDYSGFSVFFERDHVIHSVVPHVASK